MSNVTSDLLTLFFLALSCCSTIDTSNKKISGYNLNNPDVSFVLPHIMREVSGITCLDSNLFACIQDENGILFIYDAVSNKISRQFTFNIDGDYEGIARVNKTIYVLRSDGTLFEISGYTSDDFNLDVYFTNIPSADNEGLCFDPDNQRLLIACKGKAGKGSEFKDKRLIYGFDLEKKSLFKDPAFIFDLKAVRQYAIDNNINLPLRKKKKGHAGEPDIKFLISDICIHPLTKKLYMLSASDHLLFIVNMNGNIEHIEMLNPALFYCAEGIAFLENGDMLITNEGQGYSPTLLRFNYTKK